MEKQNVLSNGQIVYKCPKCKAIGTLYMFRKLGSHSDRVCEKDGVTKIIPMEVNKGEKRNWMTASNNDIPVFLYECPKCNQMGTMKELNKSGKHKKGICSLDGITEIKPLMANS